MTAPPQAVPDSPVRRRSPASPHPGMPPVSPLLAAGFRWYVRRYFRKHFSAVRVAAGTAPRLPDSDAVVCYANHPGWWDPLLAVCLTAELLGGRQFYAPIDEVALAKYPVFKRLGFYGIEANRRTGSRRFLETLEKREWHALREESLATTQQRLADKSVARDARDFDCLLQGSAGVGGAYDALRRTMAWLRWTRFDPRHGGSLEREATAR